MILLMLYLFKWPLHTININTLSICNSLILNVKVWDHRQVLKRAFPMTYFINIQIIIYKTRMCAQAVMTNTVEQAII